MNWRLTALAALAMGMVFLGPATTLAQDPAFPAADPFGPAPAAADVAPPPTPAQPSIADEANETPSATIHNSGPITSSFILVACAILAFLMIAGFTMVEAGFHSSLHTVNILFKSALGLCVGILVFWCLGYGFMDPSGGANPPAEPNAYLSFGGFGVDSDSSNANSQANWLFQMALAVVAAAIVSAAMGGRTKFAASLITAAIVTALIFPVCGYWAWGGGWLERTGFHDAAGSLVLHALGGFAALAGAITLGPRLGRYTPEGKPVSIPGHSLPLATLGLLLLMIGWQGIHLGSQFGIHSPGTNHILLIAVNTMLAAAAGGVAVTFLSWVLFSKPDLSMALNGILAGLVGIAAGCDGVSNLSAMVIGAIAGMLAVAGIIALDKLQIDDPVGIFPVHGLGGVWGALAVSIFADYGADAGTLAAQLKGIVFICGWSFGTMYFVFSTLKTMGLLRVRPADEQRGLDIAEHGMSAYAA